MIEAIIIDDERSGIETLLWELTTHCPEVKVVAQCSSARELKSKSVTKHKSLGMKMTTNRIAMTNRLYNINASVTIKDLEDHKGRATGTRVTLRIPV